METLEQFKSEFTTQLSAMSKKHVTLNYTLIGAVVVLALIFGGLQLHTMQKYGEAVGGAKVLVEKFKESEDERQAALKEAYKTIADLSSNQKVIERTIEYRDKKAAETIDKVTSPTRTDEQVVNDSQAYLKATPIIFNKDNVNLFGFDKPTVQGFVKTNIERNTFEANYNDKSKELDFEKQKTALLNKSLTDANDNLKDAKSTIVDLNGKIHKTKKQHIMDGIKAGGIFLAGYGAGRATGK